MNVHLHTCICIHKRHQILTNHPNALTHPTHSTPQSKLITPSALVERLKINGSLARAALRELKEKGLVKPVSLHHSQIIYTRNTSADE